MDAGDDLAAHAARVLPRRAPLAGGADAAAVQHPAALAGLLDVLRLVQRQRAVFHLDRHAEHGERLEQRLQQLAVVELAFLGQVEPWWKRCASAARSSASVRPSRLRGLGRSGRARPVCASRPEKRCACARPGGARRSACPLRWKNTGRRPAISLGQRPSAYSPIDDHVGLVMADSARAPVWRRRRGRPSRCRRPDRRRRCAPHGRIASASASRRLIRPAPSTSTGSCDWTNSGMAMFFCNRNLAAWRRCGIILR